MYLPILFVVLAAIYWKEIISVPKKYIGAALICGLILCLPMLNNLLFDPSSLSRAKGVSVFSQDTTSKKLSVEKLADDKVRGDILGLLIDNRRVGYAKSILSGYISHFNPNWLFITGDIPRHHAPGMGLLYLMELPFLLVGLYILIFGNLSKKTKLTLLAVLLITPIPASITTDVPHAVRTINFLPVLQIITALGLITVFGWVGSIKYEVLSIKQLRVSFILYTLFLILAAFNIIYYLNQYFVQQNYFNAKDWQYGYKQAFEYINSRQSSYDKVFVSGERPLDQSYIFFLFYLKYPAEKYQSSGSPTSFGKFIFKKIEETDLKEKNSLFVTGPEGIGSLTPDETILNPDGSFAIKIFENK